MSNKAAKDIMSRNVFKVRADWTLHELAEFLIDSSITGAPVIDEAGQLVGVVSEKDIVRHDGEDDSNALSNRPHEVYVSGWDSTLAGSDFSSLQIDEERELFVRDIMSSMVIKVDEEATVSEIAERMIEAKVHRVLVTSADKLVGVITTMDMVALLRN